MLVAVVVAIVAVLNIRMQNQLVEPIEELSNSPLVILKRHRLQQQLKSEKIVDSKSGTTISIHQTHIDYSPRNNHSKDTHTDSFHRWGDPKGIPIEPLWHYMQLLVREVKHQKKNPLDYYALNGPIPALVDPDHGLTVARNVYGRRINVRKRFNVMEPFIQQALSLLNMSESSMDVMAAGADELSSSSFPHLRRALQHGGLPLIFLADDFTGCLKHNYNYTPSYGMEDPSATTKTMITTTVPFWTLSFSPDCDYSFPLPSYAVLDLMKPTSHDWDKEFVDMDERYPWSSKLPQAVWRGALSGLAKGQKSVLDIPRVQLLIHAKKEPDLLDVKLACTCVGVAEDKPGQGK